MRGRFGNPENVWPYFSRYPIDQFIRLLINDHDNYALGSVSLNYEFLPNFCPREKCRVS